jgi:hypothetical protein
MSQSNVNSFQSDTENPVTDLISFAWYNEEQVTKELHRIVQIGDSVMFTDGSGTMHLKSRHWKQGGASVASYSTLSEGFDRFEYVVAQSSIRNKIRVSGQPRKVRASTGTIAWIDQVLTIPGSSHIGFILNYVDTDDSNSRAPAVDVVTPQATTDYLANTNSAGTGSNLTSVLSLQFTAYAESAVCSLFNGGGSEAFVTQFRIRGKSAQLQPALSKETQQSSSQSLYGRLDYTLDSDLLSLQTYIDGYTDYLTDLLKEPTPKTMFGLRNQFPDVLTRDLGDLVSLVESLTTVNSQWQVTAITHDISFGDGVEHSTFYEVRQHPDRHYLILDHATRGTLDSTNTLGF